MRILAPKLRQRVEKRIKINYVRLGEFDPGPLM